MQAAEKCCYQNIVYFGQGQEIYKDEENDAKECCCEEQVNRMNRILRILERNENFKPNDKHFISALSFYIEAQKQLDAEKWQSNLNDVEEKIVGNCSELNDSKESYKRVTWLLNDLISLLYQTVIARQCLEAEKNNDEARLKMLNRYLNNNNNLQKLALRIKEANLPLAIGGLHESFIPIWYFKHFNPASVM